MRYIFRYLVTNRSKSFVIQQSGSLQHISSYKDLQYHSTCRRFLQSSTSGGVVFKSPRPTVEIPVVPLSDFLFSKFSGYGNKTALVSFNSFFFTYKYYYYYYFYYYYYYDFSLPSEI
jgi:hypothetical protein